MNSQQDNIVDLLIMQTEMLARALHRAKLEDPYSHEVAALVVKLQAAKTALREARLAELTAAELDSLIAVASVMESSAS